MECEVDSRDHYTFQVWDFNDNFHHRFLFPSFCMGAKGALLCFDLSDPTSFEDLDYWIDLMRT
ncbi:MAG: hypothetical protein EU544_04000, partial [Promethearchaeota archaeon]